MVQRAMTHLRRQGETVGMRELTDPQQGFVDRDLYVFVLDRDGRYLAFGGQPAKVGTRVQDIPSIDGADVIRRFTEQVAQGGGWVEYDINNPTTGVVQAKMSYVVPYGDLILGAGVYKNFVG